MLSAVIQRVFDELLVTRLLLSIAVATFTVAVFHLWRHSAGRWRLLRQFLSPPGHWLWGHTTEMSGNSNLAVLRWSQKYGHAFVIFISRLAPRILLVHHTTAKALLTTLQPKSLSIDKFFYPLIGTGILNSNGNQWQRMRRFLLSVFHFDTLKNNIPMISQSAEGTALKWLQLLKASEGKSSELEVYEHMSLLTLDITLKCFFSIQTEDKDYERNWQYIKSVREFGQLHTERMNYFPYHFDFIYGLTWSGYRQYRACRVARSYCRDVVRDRQEKRAKNDYNQCQTSSQTDHTADTLDMLLDARDEDGSGLTDDEIQDEVDTFLFAGHDAPASALSWCIYNLACNEQCQNKCREEINSVLADHDDLTWSDVQQLPYLTQCIKESMRLIPSISFINRIIQSPVTLPDGRVLQTGLRASVNVPTVHRDPTVWHEPDEFIPERFNPENMDDKPAFAYLPFSAGTRNCMGHQFAMLEMKTVLAVLLHQFVFTPATSKAKPEIMGSLITRSKNGIWLTVRAI